MKESVEEILFRAGQLNLQLPKHHQIRINHWIEKLSNQSTCNPVWKKNVRGYSILLLNMLQEGIIQEPFLKMPPQGVLLQLPQHMVCSVRGNINGSSINSRKKRFLQTDPIFSSTCDKCIQTESFSNWTMIWKHSLNKMKSDLDESKALNSAMEVEIQELMALVGALKLSLGAAEREKIEMESQYEAKLQYIQSSHALEIEALNKKRSRKQADVGEKQSHNPPEHQKPSLSFLDYIDNFFSETDHIAQTYRSKFC